MLVQNITINQQNPNFGIRINKNAAVTIIDNFKKFGAKFNDDIYVLRLPNPIDRYYTKWNTSKFIKSALGKYFEKNICDFIKNIIDKDFS